MFLSKIKLKVYNSLVSFNPNVKSHYEGYKDSNQEYHKKHKIKSWKYLYSLRKYYLGKKDGELPKAPKAYTPKTIGGIQTGENPQQGRKIKLPYLDGAESGYFKRPEAIYFVKDLLKYDVISFDIFDTLILRPFAKPTDLFMIVGNKLNIMNFTRIRIDAEKIARDEAYILNGNYEVSIYDIYQKVSQRTGLDVKKGVEAEFEAEIEFCFANPYMMRVFKLLKGQEKKIIITSDMYMPHDMMEKLLLSCGYTGYLKLYVSCDYSCSKRSGGLYKNIRYELGDDKKIVHIGDNYASDIESANRNGIDTRYYKNCHEIGNQYRTDGMSELIGSIYAGIINTHLHNGIKQYNPYYEYGFIYGGLYVMGYCNWIYRKAKQEGIDKILFLSRDGDIYQKIFNMLFDDMSNEYVFWSRIVNIKCTAQNNRDDFLTRIVQHKIGTIVQNTISDILKSIGLECLEDKLQQHDLSGEQILVSENKKKFEKFLIDNWDKIIEIYDKSSEAEKIILEPIIKGNKKVAIVDVGWLGSGALGLKYLVEEKWKWSCKVKCWVAASQYYDPTYNVNQLMNDEIEAYMFSRMYNRNLYDVHRNTNKGTNNIFFEIFTQANYPSYSGADKSGKLYFDIAEVENYRIIKYIHEGIIDFCKIYQKIANKNNYLFNISGYDAYIPYRFAIKNLRNIKNIFSNFTFARTVGGNERIYRCETIAEILKKNKI